MTNFKATKYPNDNMSLLNRGIRVGLGLAVIFGTLSHSINNADVYPMINLIATIIVLTGITGWDPFYATFRDIMSRKWRTKPYGYLTRRRYI